MAGGINLDKAFNVIANVRKNTQIPIVFLMYANTIHYYKIDKFFAKCKEVGVDGVIVPDLPTEEKEEFDVVARDYDVDIISLVAPTSKDRTKAICENARGFLYCVSSLGVTGTRDEIKTNFGPMFDEIDKYANIPTALGFGISTPEQAKALKEYADAIIVGSAIVKIIEQNGANSEEKLYEFASSIVNAIN